MGIFSLFKDSETLYFPGCNAYYKNKWNFELYKKIFSKLGIDVKTIEKNNCCGLKALEFGYESEARKLARKNLDIFKEQNIKKIITACPGCYKMLLGYKEMLPDWDIEIKNIWKLVLKNLAEKPKLIKKKTEKAIGYHDSCYLGRYSNIYDEPRHILELIGYIVQEITDSRENSMCCGSCGGLLITNPALADKIAKQRLLQAKRIGIKKIVVTSLENYELLKRNSEESGVEIFELSQILAEALGIEYEENKEIKNNFENQIILDTQDSSGIKEKNLEEET